MYFHANITLILRSIRRKLPFFEVMTRNLCVVRAFRAVHSLHFMIRVRYVGGYLEY